MKNYLPIKVLSIICMALRIASLLTVIVCITFQKQIVTIYMSESIAEEVGFFVPRMLLAEAIIAAGFAIALFILTNKLNGKSLIIVSIAFAVALVLRTATSGITGQAELALTYRLLDQYQIAAYSSLTSAAGLFTAPLNGVAAACYYMICGMGIVLGIRERQV